MIKHLVTSLFTKYSTLPKSHQFSLINKPIYCFSSSSKKYTSSFKLRAKLANFFKHIHPDQMNQAPTKIKQQNMRSLKNFNEYIDAINQQKSIEGKLLKFYISEKTNHKSKKFYSFNLELPEIQTSKMTQQKAQRLLDDIVNALNTKFNQAQEGPTAKKLKKSGQASFRQQDTQQIKIQTEDQRIQRQQQTIKPFQEYKNNKDRLTMERLKNEINAKYMQTEKDNLEMKLRKNVSFADTASSRPMMWARLSMEQSGLYKDYQSILNSLIDPKLIFFSETINDKQIEEFKKKLLPGNMNPATLRDNDYVNTVCQQMQTFEPPFCFLVSDHYAADQIPGFFTVPFNFKPKQLKQQFDSLKGQIQQQQQTYIQYYDYYKELQKQLRDNNNINVSLKEFRNNPDISEKILMMKRLSRYSLLKPDAKFNRVESHPTFYPMTKEEYDIAVTHYSANIIGKDLADLLNQTALEVKIQGKRKVFHVINFKDQHMEDVIQRINASDELNYKYAHQEQLMEQMRQEKEKQKQQNEKKNETVSQMNS